MIKVKCEINKVYICYIKCYIKFTEKILYSNNILNIINAYCPKYLLNILNLIYSQVGLYVTISVAHVCRTIKDADIEWFFRTVAIFSVNNHEKIPPALLTVTEICL